jgi:hypothetical protein
MQLTEDEDLACKDENVLKHLGQSRLVIVKARHLNAFVQFVLNCAEYEASETGASRATIDTKLSQSTSSPRSASVNGYTNS